MVPELCGGAPAGAVDRYGLRALVRQAALGAGFKQAETGQDLTGRDRYLRAVR